MNTDDLPTIILTLVIAGLILFVGINAVSTTISTTDSETGTVQTAATLDGTDWTRIDDSAGVDETVYNSRGFAVELLGQDNSYVQSEQPIDVTDDETWTASLWASRNASEDMAALSLNGRLIVSYNNTEDNWTAWYYDDGSSNSYEVSINATSPQNALENVVVVRDGGTLSLYANTTNSNSISITGSSGVAAPVNNTNWDGRLEEIRLSDTAWNSTIRDTHYNNPIDPLPTNHSGRIMFDEPYRDTQRLFYAPGDIETYNVRFVQGHPGQQLTSSNILLEQSDYEWRQEGPQIRAIEGGELDGAPVAYVDYTDKGIVATLVQDWNNAVSLAGVALILLPLGVIITYLFGIRGKR